MISSRRAFIAKTLLGVPALGAALSVNLKGCSARRKTDSTLSLLFLTDIHVDGSVAQQQGLEGASARLHTVRPDLVVFGGDLISDGLSAESSVVQRRFREGTEFLKGLAADVLPVIGNHDLHPTPSDNDGRDVFLNAFGLRSSYSSITTLGTTFILLDSLKLGSDGMSYAGVVSEEQLAWLQDLLAETPKSSPIVLISHMPLLTTRYQFTEGGSAAAPANRVLTNSHSVLSLFAEHNLTLVLQGHLHVYEELSFRQTQFITGGAISGGWWSGSWLGTPAGYTELALGHSQPHSTYRELLS